MIPAQRSRFESLAIEWGAAFEASPVSPATSCRRVDLAGQKNYVRFCQAFRRLLVPQPALRKAPAFAPLAKPPRLKATWVVTD
jgi:hypothetical protein